MQKIFSKKYLIQAAILLIFTFLIFFPINLTKIAFHDVTDFGTHMEIARDINENPKFWSQVASHPCWQMMVLTVKNIFSIRMWQAALMVQMGAQVLLAMILYLLISNALPASKSWLSVLLTLALMIAAPVFLFVFEDGLYYFGYLGINGYHNPTSNVLKPFALMVFGYAVTLINGEEKRYSLIHIIASAFLVILSSLIKPSFTICLMPALGILIMIRFLRQEPLDWRFAIFGFILPAIAVSGYQYLITYTSDEIGIIFQPFTVARNLSGRLAPKFILSIWFPLLVQIFYWKKAVRDSHMILAWLAFLFGIFFTYFLEEGGWRMGHGNFTWSGEIANFILFVTTAHFFFKQWGKNKASRKWFLILVFGFVPHIIAGCIYYTYCLMNDFYT